MAAETKLEVRFDWQDGKNDGISRIRSAVALLVSGNHRKYLAHAVNDTTDRVFTGVKRDLAKQTGLPQHVIVGRNAIRKTRAKPDHLEATIIAARQSQIPLKDARPRQNKTGVNVKWFGGSKTLAHMFIVDSLSGHVFMRIGPKVRMTKGRYKGKMRQRIFKRYWAPIPPQMVKDSVARNFQATVNTKLPERTEHYLKQLANGTFA